MSNLTTVSFEINSNLKKQADALFQKIGLDMEKAIILFLYQCIKEKKLPFDIDNTLNSQSIDAMIESLSLLNDTNTKSYEVEEALKELKK